ncbi:hypothetical protein SEUCBS139899_002315 [Sporothrix eucalyptigena]|uniref:HNH nuclease domain-containing protein n=1 Tax=Sporothrix eucalyptigena TaxID=1812306 RepID=A0ABP0BVZ9_9PEZI
MEQRMHDDLSTFINDPSTRHTDIDQLVRYLRSRPEAASIQKTLPVDEMEERLEFAKKALDQINVTSSIKSLWQMPMAVIMTLPLDQLRILSQQHDDRLSNVGNPLQWSTFHSLSSEAEELTRIFLIQGNQPSNKTNSVCRDKMQSELCSERDGRRCVLTGTLNPDVCHIFPFSANSSEEKSTRLRNISAVFYSIVGERSSLVLERPSSSDECWNMICLNKQLHSWWARGHFAFKCLGVLPEAEALTREAGTGGDVRCIVKLQFHWLPLQPLGKAVEGQWLKPLPNADREAWVRDWEQRSIDSGPQVKGEDSGFVAAIHAATSRLVQTGHVINIVTASMEDGLRMKAMFDIQWACIRIASMSGAAGDPTFVHNPFDDLDSDSMAEADENIDEDDLEG